jgi:RP/EB family microtubule-associated protein
MATSADNVVGMMDAAYFTSRKDILDWLNSTLELKLTKIEQTASGAVACQIIEYICPGSIPLKRVNWDAKMDHEYVQNYKLLQNAFTKHHIQRHIEVDKLVRAKYQDNLEFCQWLKAFFDQAAPPHRAGYDPVAARCKGRGGKTASQRFQKTASQHTSKLLPVDRPGGGGSMSTGTTKKAPVPSSTVRNNSQYGRTAAASSAKQPTSTTSTSPSSGRTTRATPHQRENLYGTNSSRVKAASASSQQQAQAQATAVEHKQLQSENGALKQTNESLQTRNAELELTLVEMERERDFYFEKLSDIEVMLQHNKESGNNDNDNNTADLKALLGRVYGVLVHSDDNNNHKGGDVDGNENDEQDDHPTGSSALNMSVDDQPLSDAMLDDEEDDDDDEDIHHDDSLLDDLLSDEVEDSIVT